MKYIIDYDNYGGSTAVSITNKDFAIRINREIKTRPLDYFKRIDDHYNILSSINRFNPKLLKDALPKEQFVKAIVNLGELLAFIEKKSEKKKKSKRNSQIDIYIKLYERTKILNDEFVKKIEEIGKQFGSKISDFNLMEFVDLDEDTGVLPEDTVGLKKDTVGLKKDTVGLKKDTVGLKKQSSDSDTSSDEEDDFM